jgi:choline dehydrogenase-like flavoprotein
MNVAVVGSSFSGIAVATALIARGIKVTLVDVGEALDDTRRAAVARMNGQLPEQRAQDDLNLIAPPSTKTNVLPKKVHFGSDYIYAQERPFFRLITQAMRREPVPTFAQGGYSNIWGAAVLAPDACDIADWPVSHTQMQPYFRKAAELMPISGGQGTLEQAFPAYKDKLGSVDPGAQGKALLDDLQRVSAELSARQILYGNARLAIHTEESTDARRCNGCGECFAGCVRGSIFSTRPALEDMIARKQIDYRPGIYVRRVSEVRGLARLEGLMTESGEPFAAEFDAVFLASGPISTTSILLRSKNAYDEVVPLKESEKFLLPMIRLRGADTMWDRPGVTLSSLFLETKVKALSDHWVHVQVVSMNPLILAGSGLPGRGTAFGRKFWGPLLRRTMIAWCALHSDHSSHFDLRLRNAGNDTDVVELKLQLSPKARAAAQTAATDLFRKGLLFHTLIWPWALKFDTLGTGTHSGSSFPMRETPAARFDSDTLGRPFGWKRIFAVDASVLPSIPATTLAFSVVANAYRIGSMAEFG